MTLADTLIFLRGRLAPAPRLAQAKSLVLTSEKVPVLRRGTPEGHVLITFESVTKRYPGGTVAVDSLDLEVPGGQTMVLVGPSGCGKTTTLRMIIRLIDPTSGRILLDGRDIQLSNPDTLRRGIGYVIQQAGLFPHKTIEDNIGTVPSLLGWKKARARDRARELMGLVGLDEDLARRYPYQLSGGQQQRVGVARRSPPTPRCC